MSIVRRTNLSIAFILPLFLSTWQAFAATSIPGRIEAEDYNTGGEGVGYHDTTTGNTGGAYRSDDVDIEVTSDIGGGYNVGWIKGGEWLGYDINVQTTGDYNLELRVARKGSGTRNFHIEIDGNNITGKISAPSTGNWQSFTTVTVSGLALTEGPHFLKVYADNSDFNLNWLQFTLDNSQPNPVDNDFQKVPIVTGAANAIDFEIADDGRIFILNRYGQIKIYKPQSQSLVNAANFSVFHDFEDGLLGMALDPGFSNNQYIYVYYSPLDVVVNRLSRFKMTGDSVDMSSEIMMIEIPVQRSICCHAGGNLEFDEQGNLYLGTGDNVYHGLHAAVDESDSTRSAERTSANTMDLLGKVLRITPQLDGSYTIPSGNLFPGGVGGRPEIYVMGARNPYKFSIDSATGWLFWADVGPDANQDGPLGPSGKDEINLTKQAGNYGWPHFIGANGAYYNPYLNYYWDPADPTNDSVWNTGPRLLPPAQPSWIAVPHESLLAGPVYHFDSSVINDKKLPIEFDGRFFYWDFNTSKIWYVEFDASGAIQNHVLWAPQILNGMGFIDVEIGPDHQLYILEYGTGCCDLSVGNGVLSRIDYTGTVSNLVPVVSMGADKTSGPLPLTVNFSGSASYDPEGGPLSYAWDFELDGVIDSVEPDPTFTYTQVGDFNAQLRVYDESGAESVANLIIYAGNATPTLTFELPFEGGFFEWGESVDFLVRVDDAEDGSTTSGEIACSSVDVLPALGHLNHSHGDATIHNCQGSVFLDTDHSINGETELFFELLASYTDSAGQTSYQSVRIYPKLWGAEFFDGQSGTEFIANTDPISGSINAVRALVHDAYIYFTEQNLAGVDGIKYRVASGGPGGTISIHVDSPTGPVISSASVPNTGSYDNWSEITATVSNPGGVHDLYFKFTGDTGETDLFDISQIRFTGAGISYTSVDNAAPTVPGAPIGTPVSSTEIDLSWAASTDSGGGSVAGYRIYRDGTEIGTSATTSYSDTGLAENTEYSYTVSAYDDAATPNESAQSAATLVSTSETPTPTGNLALGRPVFASSIESASYSPQNAVDGDLGTRWSSKYSNPQWIYVDLGSVSSINQLVLHWERAYAKAYEVQVSNDALNWTTVFVETSGNGGVDDINFSATSARYVRIYGTQRATKWGYSIFEFEVYGVGSNGGPGPLDQWQTHLIDPALPWRAIYVGSDDIDSDGLKDIVAGGAWYKNPGDIAGTWSRNNFGVPLHNYTLLRDFNGDGSIDVLGTEGQYEGLTMNWGRNDGNGTFTIIDTVTDGTSSHSEPFIADRFGGIFAPGGPYQIALSYNGGENGSSGVQLLTVPDNPSTETWLMDTIHSNSEGEGLSGGDIDGDGDIDLFQGNHWLRNEGDGTWTQFTAHNFAKMVDRNRLADIDGDNDLDAVVGFLDNNTELVWLESPDNPTEAWIPHTIAANIGGGLSLDVADMDDDGDIDVVLGEHKGATRLIIFENDNQGEDWISHIVHPGGSGIDHHDGSQVVDIDNDGDLDIVSVGWFNTKVWLFENRSVTSGEHGHNPPLADAGGPYTGSVGSVISFDGSNSSADAGHSLSYNWDFGDNSTGTGVNPNHSYSVPGSYTVTLTVNDGHLNSAPAASSVAVTSGDTAAPSVPANLAGVVVSSTAIDLDWDASTDNGGGSVAGYRIYRDGSEIGTSATTSYSDSNLAANTEYSYTVAAYDDATPENLSSQSAAELVTTSADTMAPDVPANVAGVVVSSTAINLSWNASADNGGGSVAGYRIYRDGLEIGTSATTSYSDSGLAENTQYSYTVSAYDDVTPTANESAQSAATLVSTNETPSPTGNLALDKPAFASSIEGNAYPAQNAVDGDLGTRWSSKSSNPQWIYVDLGSVFNINHVKLNWEVAYAKRYEVQVSNDALNWTTVIVETNGNGGVDDINFAATSARFVRVYGTKRVKSEWGYSIFEFEVSFVEPGYVHIPGLIQAEDYNQGGEGVGYHDTSSGNAGGDYRDEDVDIEVTSDSGGGYNIGWIESGEWLSYDVDVQSNATYNLELRVARKANGTRSLHVEVDGIDITGSVVIPSTGGWQDFITVNVPGLDLTAGPHVLTIYPDSNGFNLNWLRFTVQ